MRRPHHRADLGGRRHRRDGHGSRRPPRRRRHPRRDRRSGSYHRHHRRDAHPDRGRAAARHRAGARRGDRAHRGGRRADAAACCPVWLHRDGDRRRDAAAYHRGPAGHRPDPAAWGPAAPPAAPRRTECCRPAGVEGARAWVPPGLAWGRVPRRVGRVPERPPGAPGARAGSAPGRPDEPARPVSPPVEPSPRHHRHRIQLAASPGRLPALSREPWRGPSRGLSRGLWSRRTPPVVDARPGLPPSTTPI